MNEDKLLLAMMQDKQSQCAEKYMITNTAFLDMRQQTVCKNKLRENFGAKGFYYGGYGDAERKVAVFLPEYIEAEDEGEMLNFFSEHEEDNPLTLIRASHSGQKDLSHRDYLGSLMGMGIKRESIGDILVYKGGADILLLKELGEFLMTHYGKAGRTELSLNMDSIATIKSAEVQTIEKSDTVASLRLDSVVASIFSLSRTGAGEAVRSGSVYVNGMQTQKPDKTVNEGDKIVFRGKGKALLKEVGGNTRKNRIYINYIIMK